MAVVLLEGRCWKVAVFGGTKSDLEMDNFCGRKPYIEIRRSEVGWLVRAVAGLSRVDKRQQGILPLCGWYLVGIR